MTQPKTTHGGHAQAPTESDNLCKRLAELYPDDFAQWLFGVRGVTVEKTELSREPIRADAVVLNRADDETLHAEVQTTHLSEITMDLRMLDYYVGLKRQNPHRRVRQVLILLKKTKTHVPDRYEDECTIHRYSVVRMWEIDPQELLQYEGLLPLVTLCRADSGEELLHTVAERVQAIEEPQQKREMMNACRILAGLRYNKGLVNRILKESDMMEESVIYQDILHRGEVRGITKGRQEGRQEGLQEGLQHEQRLVLRQLARLIGKVSPSARRQIEQFGHDKLENLGESLLDFKSSKDLSAWLRRHAAQN